jgi:hypothetical protein
MGYHRHRKKIMTLREAVAQMRQDENWQIHGPFEFCPLCNCVPTEFVAKDPEKTNGEEAKPGVEESGACGSRDEARPTAQRQ